MLEVATTAEPRTLAPGGDVFERWAGLHDGFAPLYCASVMRHAFGELHASLRPGAPVLDLGCGTGHATAALGASGGFACGADVDLDTMRLGRRRHAGIHLVAADLERLPFRDGCAEAAFCFSVLQYVDRRRALEEIHRVLRPGGRFAIVENLRGNPVALAYRAVRAASFARFPRHWTPRGHLSWRGRGEISRVFPGTCFRTFHLLSPLLLLAGPIARAPADAPAGSWTRRCVETVERGDDALLRRFPVARSAAWLLVATGRKS